MVSSPGASQLHEEKLRKRAELEHVDFGPDLAVASVYEISESLGSIFTDRWAERTAG